MGTATQTAFSGVDLGQETRDLADLAMRKNAWRLLPILTLAFVFNYIDRTSVGFAGLTMNRDLGLTATEFDWGAGVLFVG